MADILLLATERTFGDAPAGGVGALVVSVAGAAGDKKPRGAKASIGPFYMYSNAMANRFVAIFRGCMPAYI